MMGAGSAGPLLIKKITNVLNRDSEAKAMQGNGRTIAHLPGIESLQGFCVDLLR
jgi:hypothetical protein